jgi:asparagine synthase (glutamine-hydrolysing)
MAKAIDHRGPDARSVFVDNSIGFAHCLLCLRPQDKSKRPVQNENGSLFALMDGSVFDYEKSRHELEKKGHKFYTDTHDEIAVHLYDEYGTNFPKHFDGDFALALWDSRIKTLVLVKHITSHKNIYYTVVNGNFIFSSEIKSLLLSPNIKKELDYGSIREYFSLLHIVHPNTMFKDIKRISPGYTMIVDKSKIHTKRYWDIDLNKNINAGEEFFIEKLFGLMNESIKKRLELCDYKNFGLFLSGGIDSTLLLYFLDKLSEEPIATYTVGVKEDLKYSRLASEYFETDHHEIIPTSDDAMKIAPKAIWNIEMPRTVGFFLYVLPKLSRKKKYVFFGESAEEIFFGRDDHPILRKLGIIRKAPAPLRQFAKVFTIFPNHRFRRFIRGVWVDDYEFYAKYRERLEGKELELLFTPQVANSNLVERLKSGLDKKLSKDFLRNFAYMDLDVWFLSQPYFCLKQDVGDPFADHNLIQFAFSIPSKIKVKNDTPRYLEKRMMMGKIPDKIIHREWQPWDAQENWANEQKDVITYFAEKLKERDIINKNVWLSKFIKNNAFYPNDHKLWNLFTLEIFCEVFLDRDAMKEPPKLKI